MSRRITDEELGKDPLLQRLRKRPVERRMPSGTQIAHIQREMAEPVRSTRRMRRLAIGWSAALVSLIVLLGAFVYVYDKPGGIADWRYSRAAGYSDTIRIPNGWTPEEAVRKFRQYASMKVIHQEDIDGGKLLFIKRFYQQGGTDLEIEFVRKSWLGWKWVMGGMYGLSAPNGRDVALDYMSLPKFQGIHGPFPVIFGQIQNASIAGVNVTYGGPEAGMKAARIIEYEPGKKIWYATLPQSADASYGIEAVDEQGTIRSSKSFEDPRDSNYMVMNKTQS